MKALVLFSGGLDSTVLLHYAVRRFGYENVTALSLNYGQKHAVELQFAKWTCKHLKVAFIQEDLSNVFKFNPKMCTLLQGSDDIPQGSYVEQLSETEVVSTYVPFRNGLFLAYATSVAMQLGAEVVMYGAHQDDGRIVVNRGAANGEPQEELVAAYPDCSPEFISAMTDAILNGTGGSVRLIAPFAWMTKAEIVKDGLGLGMTHEDFEHTWSCYNGKEEPCGVCGTCIDRKNALEVNGIFDIR